MAYPAKMTKTNSSDRAIKIKGTYYPLSNQSNVNPYGLFVSDKGNKYYDVHIAAITRL
jgi:hypothetical protein